MELVTGPCRDQGKLVNHFNGTVTYTPSAGFSEVDGFDYTVGDGQDAVSKATVAVAVDLLKNSIYDAR